MRNRIIVAAVVALAFLTSGLSAQSLSADVKAKVDAKLAQVKAWASDPAIVAAVKQHNSAPAAEAKAMTNDKWKTLTLLDPYVRSFGKNPAGLFLKAHKDEVISEAFLSGADGCKVAFLSKPSSWMHKGKPKHDVPMTGKIWYGDIEVDESSGAQQVQVGIPVLDGGKPVGSLVVGMAVAKLK